jgi:hypothetical protein
MGRSLTGSRKVSINPETNVWFSEIIGFNSIKHIRIGSESYPAAFMDEDAGAEGGREG